MPRLEQIGFKADPATVEALDWIVEQLAEPGEVKNRSAAMRRAIHEFKELLQHRALLQRPAAGLMRRTR